MFIFLCIWYFIYSYLKIWCISDCFITCFLCGCTEKSWQISYEGLVIYSSLIPNFEYAKYSLFYSLFPENKQKQLVIICVNEKKIPNGQKKVLLYHNLLNVLHNMPLRKAQVTQEGLRLHGSHQILVYSDDVKCWGNVNTKTPSRAQLAFNFQSGVTVYCLGRGNSKSCSTMKLATIF